MTGKSMVVRPNNASPFTYDKWLAIARANMLVENLIKGGSWTADEIVNQVTTETGVSSNAVWWMIL
ncbi:MAG: hypothetical protein NC548_31970 [Lachnospiraceae bacterium]|nr:hypothetical protein [Lachnospiraceae bacterium]